MKQSGSKNFPSREDFAIEEFGGEALIIRLADMRIFRVNRNALNLFYLLLEFRCDATLAMNKAREQQTGLDPVDIESVQAIMLPGEEAGT